MTEQEIIKALECCLKHYACIDCPVRGREGCMSALYKGSLAIITRQQVEIEKLQEIHADALESLRLAAEANKDLQAKIEGLEAEIKQLRKQIEFRREYLCYFPKLERAEAVREFAEKLKATPLRFRVDHIRLINEPPESKMVLFVDDSDIDNLVEEMEK